MYLNLNSWYFSGGHSVTTAVFQIVAEVAPNLNIAKLKNKRKVMRNPLGYDCLKVFTLAGGSFLTD